MVQNVQPANINCFEIGCPRICACVRVCNMLRIRRAARTSRSSSSGSHALSADNEYEKADVSAESGFRTGASQKFLQSVKKEQFTKEGELPH
eukprot:3604309-Amphidinium_carterae.1